MTPWRCLLGASLLALSTDPASADSTPRPIGSDIPVNVTVAGDQSTPVLGSSADDGDVVAVWQSTGQDGSGEGIFARRYDDGMPVGGEFQVNVTTAGDQTNPAVALDDSGGFVITWEGPDASGRGIFARVYNSSGVAATGEFPINTTTAGDQTVPAVAYPEGSRFLVVWQGSDGSGAGVVSRLFDEDGVALGAEQTINTTTSGEQITPDVAGLDDSTSYVVVWEGGGGDREILARRVDNSGVPQGGEIAVNSTTSGDQTRPRVAVSGIENDLLGGADPNLFVVVWQSADADGNGIFAQRFEVDGTPLEAEERVNLDEAGDQSEADVTVDDGSFGEVGFVVLWQEGGVLDSASVRGSPILIRGRRLPGRTPPSPPVTAVFQVNATVGLLSRPGVAAGANGDFVALWQASELDQSGEGVFARRFTIPIFSDGFQGGSTAAWTSTVP